MLMRERPTVGPDNAKDVWLLGAGFSKHIYNDMPLMSDLAKSVNDLILHRFSNDLVLSNVELALSELRSDAPWKSPADKHQDLALYELMLERIQDELQIPHGALQSDKDNVALGQRLVNTWHMNRNHVITVNYDLLVETLTGSVRCARYREERPEDLHFIFERHIYPIPIPHVRTRNSRSQGGNESEITFSYYKLHGSLNYHTPRVPFQNATMYHRHHNEVEDLAEGLQTFIVPPTYDKQTFIEHPVLHAIWNKAAIQLANIDVGRIIFIGYSMPQTDLTMMSMLRSTIRSSTLKGSVLPPIIVVNPDPDAASNYKRLLGLPNPVGKATDVTAFLEQYAPKEFVRTHVWDNRHLDDAQEEHRMYLETGGEPTESYFRRSRQFRDELRAKGRLGWEWFMSQDEFLDWRAATLRDAPIHEWL